MLSIRGMLQEWLDPFMSNAWLHMGEWFNNDDSTPFQTAHRMTFLEYVGQNPKYNNYFNDLIANDAREVAKTFISKCRGVFKGLNSVVDVGGGTGAMAKAIADAFPHINCINFDLPHVVAGLEGTKNLTHIKGDMFLAIPQADVVILKWIMHDWSDEESVKILKRCKEAIPSREKGGKPMIIEMVKDKKKSNGEDIFLDMQMMILTTGRERNEKDWAKVFVEASFSHDYNITANIFISSSDLTSD